MKKTLVALISIGLLTTAKQAYAAGAERRQLSGTRDGAGFEPILGTYSWAETGTGEDRGSTGTVTAASEDGDGGGGDAVSETKITEGTGCGICMKPWGDYEDETFVFPNPHTFTVHRKCFGAVMPAWIDFNEKLRKLVSGDGLTGGKLIIVNHALCSRGGQIVLSQAHALAMQAVERKIFSMDTLPKNIVEFAEYDKIHLKKLFEDTGIETVIRWIITGMPEETVKNFPIKRY